MLAQNNFHFRKNIIKEVWNYSSIFSPLYMLILGFSRLNIGYPNALQ
jgi:hypothetical protein